MKPCPYCGEDIKPAAVKCRYCGEWLDPDKVPPWAQVFLAQRAQEQGPAPSAGASPSAAKLAEADAPVAHKVSTSTPANTGDEDTPSMRAWEPPPWIKKKGSDAEESSDDAAKSDARPASAEDSSETVLPADDDEPALQKTKAKSKINAGKDRKRSQTLNRMKSKGEEGAPVSSAADTVASKSEEILLEDSGSLPKVGATTEVVTQVLPKVGRAAEEVLPKKKEPPPADALEDDDEDDDESNEDKPSDAAALLASFMGDDDDDDDDDDDADEDGEDFADMGGASSSGGVNPGLLIGGALAIGAVLFAFQDQIFGGGGEDPVAQVESAGDAAPTEAAETGDAPPATGAVAATAATGATGASGASGATGASGASGATGAVAATGATGASGAPAATGAAAPTGAATPGLVPDGPKPAVGTPADPAAFESVMNGAREAYMKRRLKQARKKLEEAMQMSPNNAEALELLSHIQLDSGEFDDALATAGTCLKVDASKPDCWLALAVIHEDRKNFPLALSAWEKYIELDPNGTYAAHGKGSITRLRSKVK